MAGKATRTKTAGRPREINRFMRSTQCASRKTNNWRASRRVSDRLDGHSGWASLGADRRPGLVRRATWGVIDREEFAGGDNFGPSDGDEPDRRGGQDGPRVNEAAVAAMVWQGDRVPDAITVVPGGLGQAQDVGVRKKGIEAACRGRSSRQNNGTQDKGIGQHQQREKPRTLSQSRSCPVACLHGWAT